MGGSETILAGDRADRTAWHGELDLLPLVVNKFKAPIGRSEEMNVERKMEIRYQTRTIRPVECAWSSAADLPAKLRFDRVQRATEVGNALRRALLSESISKTVCCWAKSTGCGSEGPLFVTQIDVVQAIPSLSDLARLVAAVMNDGRVEVGDRNVARAAGAR